MLPHSPILFLCHLPTSYPARVSVVSVRIGVSVCSPGSTVQYLAGCRARGRACSYDVRAARTHSLNVAACGAGAGPPRCKHFNFGVPCLSSPAPLQFLYCTHFLYVQRWMYCTGTMCSTTRPAFSYHAEEAWFSVLPSSHSRLHSLENLKPLPKRRKLEQNS